MTVIFASLAGRAV